MMFNIFFRWIFSSLVIHLNSIGMWKCNSFKKGHGNCMRSQKSANLPGCSVGRQMRSSSWMKEEYFFSLADPKTFSFEMVNTINLDHWRQTWRALIRSRIKSREKFFKSNSFGKSLMLWIGWKSIGWLIDFVGVIFCFLFRKTRFSLPRVHFVTDFAFWTMFLFLTKHVLGTCAYSKGLSC